ncbi:3-oxoacyl-ACP reductase [Kaistia algarum]|uniref:SDR family NAD(P)-dependent oxidoreductase n=1 Tax=Kaistia algarum TaxID=2083279 RepID=UPI000CE90693|nr:glucose 1-dehydrogenase [Kaistia algarum]MCX5514055.1 glucose 1-dehydrogenase [Kaistia algarum]PPE77280.1 3-oxoacyl-ACP reductase [Kaistia algarum]
MILDLFSLAGKVALVTGATRGIGLGVAQALAEVGAHVILSSRMPKPDVMASLQAAGHKVSYIAADMEDPVAPAQLVADATALHGRLDILVNNAGIAYHGDTHSFAEADYRRLMDVNVDAVFKTCQAALGPMRLQKSGVILNIGSISGFVSNIPQPQAAYNASKAAVHMLTKSLASDYASEGIRANAIAPGYIDTDMTASGFANPEWSPIWKAMTPLPMVGTPRDIGAAAVYLCSEASRYVTGEVLVVDGGYTTR